MKTRLLFGAALLAAAPLGAPSAQVPTLINVEIDYMVQPGHSHLPSQDILDALVQMFACHGITLNLWVSDAVPHINVIRCTDLEDPFWTCADPTSFATYKSLYADTAGMEDWHYCLIGHDYDSGDGPGSSGRSDGVNDFIVTLGQWINGIGTDFEVAGTFAHELGHDLGLNHASPNTFNASGPFSPNYASVMSYQYQLVGVRNGLECLGFAAEPHLYKDLDYSNGRLPILNEGALFETVGVGIHPVDWDCDGSITPFAKIEDVDVEDTWCSEPSPAFPGLVADYDDWSNLEDRTGEDSVVLDQVTRLDIDCVRRDELPMAITDPDGNRIDTEIGPQPDHVPDPSLCPDVAGPTLATEPCVAGQMVWADPNSIVPIPMGTGSTPYGDVSTAVGAAPSGSVIFLQPGAFAEPGPLVITRPMVLAGVGSSVIVP